MRIRTEQEILDPKVRARIIEEIEDSENKARKDEHYKRYQCYKDQTHLYVVNQLLKQFDTTTVIEMSYALANLAFVRKIVDKLARVYKYGIDRKSDTDENTEKLQKIEKKLSLNQTLKRTNRFYKLCRNTALYIVPTRENMAEDSKKTLKVTPLVPYLYDVVELSDNREKAGCYVLSDYVPEDMTNIYYSLNPAAANRTQRSVLQVRDGDRNDQIIADTPVDQQNFGTKDNKQYVFWTNQYHFTTNARGDIISGPEIENPIGEMPFVNYAEDQDGAFWAKGGGDLADGAIHLNSMITNIDHIGITQGYGQLVMTGKNLPRAVKVGPNKAVLLEYQKDEDPTPTFDFKTASPPLDQLRALVEMYVALLLTTNNLSTSGVQANLGGGVSFPSGIAMLIDKAESMEDIEDQREVFADNEQPLWNKIAIWLNVLDRSNELSDELKPYILPLNPEVQVKFGMPTPIQTERERLETMKLKKDLGLASRLDMLKSEFPELTDEQLREKLEEIIEEKLNAVQSFIGQGNGERDERDTGAGPGGDTKEGSDEGEAGDRGFSPRADST